MLNVKAFAIAACYQAVDKIQICFGEEQSHEKLQTCRSYLKLGQNCQRIK